MDGYPRLVLAVMTGVVGLRIAVLAARLLPHHPWTTGFVLIVVFGLLGVWAVRLRHAEPHRIRRASLVLALLFVLLVSFGQTVVEALL